MSVPTQSSAAIEDGERKDIADGAVDADNGRQTPKYVAPMPSRHLPATLQESNGPINGGTCEESRNSMRPFKGEGTAGATLAPPSIEIQRHLSFENNGNAEVLGRTESGGAKDEEEGAAACTDSSGKTSDASTAKSPPSPWWRRAGTVVQNNLPPQLAWIPPTVSSWEKMKPVLRSGLAAWICMLFLIITPVEREALGNASFLILVGIFIQPAELPLVAAIEREFFTLLLTSAAWAFSCIAIAFAHLARKRRLSPAETNTLDALDGEYIEAGPTAICATFLAVGVASALYLKVKFGPSPFIFATILACITMDITLVYAPMYPYPNYLLGRTVLVPLAIKSGITVLVSCFFFPKSVNSTFVERLQGVLKPLQDVSTNLAEMMQHSPLDDDYDFEMVRDLVTKSEAGIAPLQGSARLLTREISFGLAPGQKLKGLMGHTRALLGPIDGVAFYFGIIRGDLRGLDYARHPRASQFATPHHTRPGTPAASQPPTRPGTPKNEVANHHDNAAESEKSIEPSALHGHTQREQQQQQQQQARHRFPSRLAHLTPTPSSPRHSHDLRRRLHDVFHHQRQREQVDVALWESLRYNAVESQLHSRTNDRYTEMCVRILADISRDLLRTQAASYRDLTQWLLSLNAQRSKRLRDWLLFRSTMRKGPLVRNANGSGKAMSDVITTLQRAIDDFRAKKTKILEPFRSSLDNDEGGLHGDRLAAERIPHRYLFQSLTFCYFQLQYSARLVDLLKACETLEKEHCSWRLWFPNNPKLLRAETWWTHEEHQDGVEHDEDPHEIPGMPSALGKTQARDPDALASDTLLGNLGVSFSNWLHQLYRGHSLFMIKTGIVTVLVALPSLLRSSAGWSYRNRAIWPLIMSQLVTARHRGEVLFGLFTRAIATFLGAIIGLIIWYIASGNGIANHYAMAVVTAVAFPIVMLGRLNFPGPPITPIITCVTVALIVGYSWQDARNPIPGNPGIGWDVAWRRFIEVLIGAAASYVMAVLPPSSSMRTYFRLSHATTIRETGALFCTAVTIAATPSQRHDLPRVQAQLLAVRAKIRRLALLKGSISYEWSLRGKWPVRRYSELERIELRVLRLLTHTTTIYEHLGPAYTRALLDRTHFLDPLFLADCIAVLSMCTTSLRTRQPLPQIVPVLIDRYLSTALGFKVRKEAQFERGLDDEDSHDGSAPAKGEFDIDGDEDDVTSRPRDAQNVFAGLPHKVTFETLCDEQYQTFAVGAQVAFGIVLHLDRLCVAVKALVGETYSVPTDLQQYEYLVPPRR